MLMETVGVSSNPGQGVASMASGTAVSRVASLRTSAASSRLELVIVSSLFMDDTRSEMMSSGQGWRHTRSFPELDGSIHTPPAPSPEALQNPIWVGLQTDNLSKVSR